MLCGMWDLPGPGLEPVSPALAGGFLTTAPAGKSHKWGKSCSEEAKWLVQIYSELGSRTSVFLLSPEKWNDVPKVK